MARYATCGMFCKSPAAVSDSSYTDLEREFDVA
ncbi:hypothetical protein FRAAL3431 [Frankia alni ACN14a]|uniref:Uncharacterized protein n=1 Tax=Frankia alni (strain DSM 45986 / CECT 9034 / ACN14a) TaxID=326424 RepID=Q0RK83_FRAAA|nr:hypothetical protein FRAAL3431 [Frankia alni ACN14a]